jgi:peptidoglycan/LPS O-acetylase OafA/YrhL
MAAMPRHDPIPPRPDPGALAWARYRRMMKWMALAAAVAAALAVAYLEATSDAMPWQMVLATIAGVGLSVLLGTALMGLLFLSDRSGYDEGAHEAASRREEKP